MIGLGVTPGERRGRSPFVCPPCNQGQPCRGAAEDGGPCINRSSLAKARPPYEPPRLTYVCTLKDGAPLCGGCCPKGVDRGVHLDQMQHECALCGRLTNFVCKGLTGPIVFSRAVSDAAVPAEIAPAELSPETRAAVARRAALALGEAAAADRLDKGFLVPWEDAGLTDGAFRAAVRVRIDRANVRFHLARISGFDRVAARLGAGVTGDDLRELAALGLGVGGLAGVVGDERRARDAAAGIPQERNRDHEQSAHYGILPDLETCWVCHGVYDAKRPLVIHSSGLWRHVSCGGLP